MRMKQILPQAALFLSALALPASAFAQQSIAGRWVNPKGSVTVRVSSCGDAFCGIVVDANAHAKATARKGGTPNLVGTQILSRMRPTGGGTYKGQVFDPKRNIHAPATIRVLGGSTLVIKGCLISGIICKEQRWTRAS